MRNMKLCLSSAAVITAGMIVVASASAQVQVPATNNQVHQPGRTINEQANPDRMDSVGEHFACKSSEIVGLTVRTAGDQEKGKIKDLVIGQDGRVEYAAVSFGGFLGMGDKLFAVPWEAIHVVRNNNKAEFARIDVTEDTIKNRQGFDQEHWPDRADPSFMTPAASVMPSCKTEMCRAVGKLTKFDSCLTRCGDEPHTGR